MKCEKCLVVASGFMLAAMAIGCSPGGSGSSSQNVERAIRAMSAQTPRKVDTATTLIEVRSDGSGGIVYVNMVDTSMVEVPAPESLKYKLCHVGPDSPPAGSRNPFSAITYIYRDLEGHEVARLRFGRGECPGQAL